MAGPLTAEQTQEIADDLATGRKIDAIKRYREISGQGLKEAKAFIDALVPKLIEQDPEKYKTLAAAQGRGCAAALLVGAGLGTVATILARTVV